MVKFHLSFISKDKIEGKKKADQDNSVTQESENFISD